MKSVALLIALLCLASIAPAATAAELNYSLYLLAVPLADATFTLDQSAAAYRMTMSFHTTGLADLFASDQLAEHITGRIENDRLVPYDYGSSSRLRGQDRLVGLVWRNGTPVATAIVPPNAGEREEVPASLLPNTIDPLSAIVLMLRQVAAAYRCSRRRRSARRICPRRTAPASPAARSAATLASARWRARGSGPATMRTPRNGRASCGSRRSSRAARACRSAPRSRHGGSATRRSI